MRLAKLFLRLVGAVVISCIPALSRGQETFYYHSGEKVTLQLKDSKQFLLFKANIERGEVENAARSKGTVLRRFDAFTIPSRSLDLSPNAAVTSLRWAIIDNVTANAALDQGAADAGVVYRAPFFTTAEGAEVGISHLIYVKVRDDQGRGELDALARELRLNVIGVNKFMPQWVTVACTSESAGNALTVANRLFESGKFAAAEPDFLTDFQIECANDTHFAAQWGLKNTGQGGGTVGMDLGLCDAWNHTTGSGSVIVAVLDQGVELNHPDLPRMSSASFNTVTGSSPSQVEGNHGTPCAGIIGAASQNGLGVAGIAPGATVMSVSHPLTLAPGAQQQLADGLNWAWRNGAGVISNSWGHSALASPLIDDAIVAALAQGRGGLGTVVVFAAGNANGSVIYPARSNPGILAVGAMSPCGERKSPTSCDQETWWGSCFGAQLDVVAPGVRVPATDRQGSAGYDVSDYTLGFNGTSSACPHVAGVAALILSVNPHLTGAQVSAIIESSARKVGPYPYATTAGRPHGTWHQEMGYGLVNALACVEAALPSRPANPVGPSITASPSPDGGPIAARPIIAPTAITKPEDGHVQGATAMTAPDGYLESLPQGPNLEAVPNPDPASLAAGFSYYNNVGVNLNTTLLGTDGTTQISVYAGDIRWRYAFGQAPDVSSPRGNGGTAGDGWTFRNAHRFGITIFQGANYWNVTSTSSGSPTVITGLSNTQAIRVTVNDTNGNYADNSGAFDIYVRKDN